LKKISIILFLTLLLSFPCFAGDEIPTTRGFLRLLDGSHLFLIDDTTGLYFHADIISIGPGETYETPDEYLAGGVYCLGDILRFTGDITNGTTITVDGATGHDVMTIDGAGYTLTCTPCEFGGDYWQLYDLNIAGFYEISGQNTIVRRGTDLPFPTEYGYAELEDGSAFLLLDDGTTALIFQD